MATTWPKRALFAVNASASHIQLLERRVPEGATQTFPAGAPLKISSNLVVEWTAGADLAYLSLAAGQNTTGAQAACLMMMPGIELEGNFLATSAADNVLAAGDFGTAYVLAKSSTLLGTGNAGWYVEDNVTNANVKICEFFGEQPVPNVLTTYPEAGDTNARVRVTPLISLLYWYD
jgi:hypothetical protein